VNASCDAAAGVMVNAALVALVKGMEEATRVYPPPALLIDRPEKVATPFIGFTVVVPESVPPPGFAPSTTVTAPVALVTVFPEASWIATAGAIPAPAVALLGCTVKESFVAAPVEGGWVEPPQAMAAAPITRTATNARERMNAVRPFRRAAAGPSGGVRGVRRDLRPP
jgi:hypothetical protein